MDLTKTKKELLDLIDLIKSNREDLKKELEEDTKYFNSILEEIKSIKNIQQDFEKMNIKEIGIKTDIQNFKITFKEIEKITQKQDLELEKIYESIKDKNIENDTIILLKDKILKDKRFKRKEIIKRDNTTDLIFRGLIVVSLIFSTINLLKGGNTETIEQPQQREHIKSSVSPYCIDNYDNKGQYTPFTQHKHLKGECRE